MSVVETFARYRDLISTALGARPSFEDLSLRPRPLPQAQGQKALFLYARLMNFKARYESMPSDEFARTEDELRADCEAFELTVENRAINPDAAWTALGLHVAGKLFIRDAWTDLSSDFFGRAARGQTEAGRFLPPSNSTHPEIAWFDELALLHASASYAVQAEDRHTARAVAKCSSFIFREIEPDHATHQPFALFAFIWKEETRPLADQIVHSIQLRRDTISQDNVSLILLADTLYCLGLFL